MSSKLVLKHCQVCEEITPQADNNTTGHTCQVCLSNSNYGSECAVVDATAEQLAAFWQRKYYDLKGNYFPIGSNGQNSVTIQNGSTVPFLLNEP